MSPGYPSTGHPAAPSFNMPTMPPTSSHAVREPERRRRRRSPSSGSDTSELRRRLQRRERKRSVVGMSSTNAEPVIAGLQQQVSQLQQIILQQLPFTQANQPAPLQSSAPSPGVAAIGTGDATPAAALQPGKTATPDSAPSAMLCLRPPLPQLRQVMERPPRQVERSMHRMISGTSGSLRPPGGRAQLGMTVSHGSGISHHGAQSISEMTTRRTNIRRMIKNRMTSGRQRGTRLHGLRTHGDRKIGAGSHRPKPTIPSCLKPMPKPNLHL